MLLGDNNDGIFKRDKRTIKKTKEAGTGWGRGPTGYSLFLPGGFSGKGRDAARIGLEKEGSGAIASPCALSTQRRRL